MKVFLTLCKKEWMEAWRDKKLIWLPIVIIILAVTQPITNYYLPQILDMAGNLPEGAVIEIPTPSGEEVLIGTLSQLGMIGLAIFVLSVMGTIANERNSGALSLIMARPVQPIQYIGSKWLVNFLIVFISFALGYGLSYYYTNLLFNEVEIHKFLASLGVYSLWLLFAVAVTIIFGTVFKKVGGIAGASLVTIATLALCRSLFPKFFNWSPASASSQVSTYLQTGSWGESFYVMLFVSIALLIGLFLLNVVIFKRYESYQ